MKNKNIIVPAFLLVLVLSLTIVAAFPKGPDANKEIANVRKATNQYHDIQNAIDDGYVPASPCVELPGTRAIGYHYVNFALVNDGVIDPLNPEVLLCLKLKNHIIYYMVVSFGFSILEHPKNKCLLQTCI